MTDARRSLGARGEQAVAAWYVAAGYGVLAANWRCTQGEVDLVLESSDGTVVFCEVKTRTSSRFGTGFDAVPTTKQRRLRRIAACWLSHQRSQHPSCRQSREVRFDVAAVSPGDDGNLSIEVIEGAF